MQSPLRTLAFLALLANCACSTVVEGPSQKITVNSSPQGAQCLFRQADDIVARITTPGTAEIPKSKNDLVILCSKEGYESVSVKNRSDMALTSLGNMAFYQLSFVGDAVDSATGASNKYDSKVFVELTPAPAPAVFPAPPGALPLVQLPMQAVGLMSIQPPVPLPPASMTAPLPVAFTPAVLATNPPLYAADALGKAALKASSAQQVMPLTYAQAMTESPRRPPFDITQ